MDISRASSLNAIKNLNNSLSQLGKSFAKLSSGKRINSAADDAAGLAIAAGLDSSARTRGQASRNIDDGQSAIQIADGALSSISGLQQRNQELAAQAANGTLSDEQRASLDKEFQQNNQEIQRIKETTSFNGQSLLSSESITIQAGNSADASSQITIQGISLSSSSGSIATAAGALAALDSSKSDLANTSAQRGNLGAVSNRLGVARNNNEESRVNEIRASSRIKDADVAEETSNLVKQRILVDSSSAVLAQTKKLDSNKVKSLLS